MKKKLALLLVAAMAVSVLATGCGENEKSGGSSVSEAATEPEVYTAEYMLASTEYDVEDYVKLANYKKFTIEIDQSYEITDEAIEAGANTILENYPYNMTVDRAAKEGDVVNIDYYGTKDGLAFEGGTAAQYDLTLGSGTFIDGFEEGLIGYSAGEEVILNLTFPEDYSSEELAGQEVQFEVTINAVMEPTLITYDQITDDYVKQNFYTSFGITTVDDFNGLLKESLQNNLDTAVQRALLEKLVAESEVTFPEGLLDKRVQETIEAYEAECEYYGMTLEEYVETYGDGITVDEFKADIATTVEESLDQELVLEALVADLKCEVQAADFDTFIAYYASSYYLTEDEFMEQAGGKDYLLLSYAGIYVALELAADEVKVEFVETTE